MQGTTGEKKRNKYGNSSAQTGNKPRKSFTKTMYLVTSIQIIFITYQFGRKIENRTADTSLPEKEKEDQVSFILYNSINIRYCVQSNLKTEETNSYYAMLRV